MKRLVQVLMVAAVVSLGAAHESGASTVAIFRWEELCSDPDTFIATASECNFGETNLTLTVLSTGMIRNISYIINGDPSIDPGLPTDPSFALDGSNADPADDLVNVLTVFQPGEVLSVLVGFDYFDGGVALRFSRLIMPNLLISQDSPTYWSNPGTIFYLDEGTPAPIPEPTSLALFGLAAAGAAFVRRRRA